jgi:hypothetical protein
MSKLPLRRLTLYLVIIATLLGVWAAGETGVLPLGSRVEREVFKVPEDPNAPAVGGVELDEYGNPRKRGQQGDEFEDALRRLAAEGSDSGDLAPGSDTPVPTTTPTVTPGPSEAGRDGNFSGDDARRIFSGLETPEGSKVEDYGLAGVVSRGGGVGPLPTPEETPGNERAWASGQARGYTMLYAMQPEARAVVELHIQTLLSARIREMYIGVLIDGFFGPDFTYLKDVIRRLSSDERSLKVALYLSNGATMRKWSEKRFDSLFARIDPEEFRQRIRREQFLRAQYLAVAIKAREIFAFNESLNSANSNVAIVMLEDNLDALAYRSMRELASQEIGSLASFVRNPCLGCYQGNDDNTLGDPREEHEIERLSVLKAGDGYSFDGEGFQYPNSPGPGVSADTVLSVMRTAVNKKLSYVGLWRHDWQGVIQGVPNKLPKERNYIPPSPDQEAFDIRLLRAGLLRETSSAEEEEGGDNSLGVE